MTPVHCADDMPEIERLRAEVQALRDAAAVDDQRVIDVLAHYGLQDMHTDCDTVDTLCDEVVGLRREVEALRALVASLRADVRAISDSIDADAARAISEARRVSGYARAAALTKERRTEIARNAGKARWRKVRDVLDDSQPMEAPPCD